MLIDNLQKTYLSNKGKNPVVIRNVLKETIQFYILDFVYKSTWGENFILKGGTCLRFCFDLPRLSEDLDFDIKDFKNFSLNHFLVELENYFKKTLQFDKIIIKLANNKRTVYLKFPILSDLGMNIDRGESNIVIIRLDLAPVIGKNYKTEISIKSTYDFSFLIKRYSLQDLFVGKLAAILTREAMIGKLKSERFKGRDFFDLIWFLEKKVKPNWIYLKEITEFGRKETLKKLEYKINKVDPNLLKSDLMPFFEDKIFIDQFIVNFKALFQNYKNILTE
ncbi:hypothetical protein COS31_00060 [Candidatus Roizmanbacteria bacterium CG02_land_8_20_14_3_00_36_15]|uniref:Nucleotidyl transferase AbiEii/AbiGii toxin family protein n=2 Tax=Candidatus Roizmaniibacteriota TaxID=1752723 RepID=A0A2M8KKH3_9BACT|nr:MAG: hypothetical protein COS51_00940 [Candidatus Roizmanbacteria bacterium CG03_land_8_20_14_0_80_36_21]PIV38324.1 MAG: hypothetical protein COS31_00060 [Candidatus Roizmanbacteria bacterium CG02_land_8_20_14_3_00_36_15]PIY69810.1 MAG: hypothetical protein COY89_04465 [Candidatus Roizmanbacteria bacterium CG_4_10_14_0_8_um_filter_36_36]PJA52972.1 MAG: hypothetical protein CO166_03495 [Candidatus Roizmanbacteria bacterium CG_4_9_14_3_um_filter_36_11]PJC81243.1 MAG: hypothetical protein CO007